MTDILTDKEKQQIRKSVDNFDKEFSKIKWAFFILGYREDFAEVLAWYSFILAYNGDSDLDQAYQCVRNIWGDIDD